MCGAATPQPVPVAYMTALFLASTRNNETEEALVALLARPKRNSEYAVQSPSRSNDVTE